MAACRSCGAPIIWAVTQGGSRMPIDAEPVDGGNVILHPAERGQAPTVTVVGKRPQRSLFGDDGPRYTSHFATCPNASSHRSPRPAASRRNPPPARP